MIIFNEYDASEYVYNQLCYNPHFAELSDNKKNEIISYVIDYILDCDINSQDLKQWLQYDIRYNDVKQKI